MILRRDYQLPWSGKPIDPADIQRLDDDGCPNRWPELDEEPTTGVTETDWGIFDWSVNRIYSCSLCGWFVWHPISYCHKCPGRMRVIQGTTKQLQEHMRKHGYEDGGL